VCKKFSCGTVATAISFRQFSAGFSQRIGPVLLPAITLAIAVLSILAACGLLVALSVIDVRVRLLPNRLVLGVFISGLVFHISTAFACIPPEDALFGAAAGYVSLYCIRLIANAWYEQDAMGLGDVKLVGAGGVWVGIEGIFAAIALGALAGVLHGLGHAAYKALRNKEPVNLGALTVPAGPGFAAGLAAVSGWMLTDFFRTFFALAA
jgi:leader peptidase (prepilin peptidase)/N-methyltransferase